ncbi:MAG: DEAD/DEAH box helicase [Bacillota bacterium]|nr:DEAD/DEAH box helicase [Bacillota bacterium]
MLELIKSLSIDESIFDALKKQNITDPTQIQKVAIPKALSTKDLIVQSETGSGKTLAYLIPIFERIKRSGNSDLFSIILVPTHELAVQVHKQIELLSQNSDIKLNSALIIGNVNIDRQIIKLREKPQIIVGSAGRILELIKKKKITAHTVKTIIIDEADRMLLDNALIDVKAVIKTTLKERQIMMFSATISNETVNKAQEIMKEFEFIKIEGVSSIPSSIEHYYFVADQREKIDMLRKLVRAVNPQKAIVFANRNDDIEVIKEKLLFHKIDAEAIQGKNGKLDRKFALDEFRSGKVQLLIASDIAARGIDIEGITHVFNLNAPEDPKAYQHRVGRTGRGGRNGVVMSIVTSREVEVIKSYEKAFNIKIAKRSIYKGVIIEPRIHTRNRAQK